MAHTSRPQWSRYGMAVGVVALATAARLALDPLLGPGAVAFITMYPAVAAAAWWGGRGPALLAIVLSIASTSLIIVAPAWTAPRDVGYWASVAVFALMGWLIATLVEHAREAQREAQRRADALAVQEEWLRVTMASIGDAVVATDTAGRVTLLNPVAETLTGWTSAEARGRPLEDVFRIIHETTRRPVPTPVARVLEEGRVMGLANHTVLIARDGTERPIEDSAAPIRDPRGQVYGVVMVFRDASEQRRAAHAERTSAERLALALDAGRLGVWEWNLADGSVWWSDNLEAIHGLEPGAFGGTVEAFRALVHPDDRADVDARIARAIAEQGDYEVLFRTQGPAGRWISGKGRVFADEDGRPQRMVGITIDVTAQRTIQDALVEADRRKDEFLATLAHELRNPLAPIRNALEIMRMIDPSPIEASLRAREMMSRQVAHMTRLLDDLLDVSRITRDRLELRVDRVALADVLRSAIETAGPALHTGRRFTADLGEPAWVNGDHTRLAQVFANLLNNAVKFTGPDGEISVTVRTSDPIVEVTVRDDGAGFDGAARDRIFDLFAQVAPPPEGVQAGLGIGLTIARRLVEMHGGTLRAHSDGPGRGSAFTVVLPRADAPVAAVSTPPPAASRAPLRILVADDNSDAAHTLAMMLRLWGHQVAVALDGVSALEAARQSPPDLALLDIGMPRMSGLEVAREMRTDAALARVMLVAVTGWGQAQDKMLADDAGFDVHLTKPVDPGELRRMLATAASPG